MKLHQFVQSPYCAKVRYGLAHKGLDWQARNVTVADWRAGVLKQLGPAGTLPVLELTGEDGLPLLIQGSGVILRELDRRHPQHPLYPAEPGRLAQVQILESWGDESLSFIASALIYTPSNVKIFLGDLLADLPWWARRRFLRSQRVRLNSQGVGRKTTFEIVAELNAHLESISIFLQDAPWLTGDTFTAADAAVCGQLMSIVQTPECANLMSQRPRLIEWMDAVAAGPRSEPKEKKPSAARAPRKKTAGKGAGKKSSAPRRAGKKQP